MGSHLFDNVFYRIPAHNKAIDDEGCHDRDKQDVLNRVLEIVFLLLIGIGSEETQPKGTYNEDSNFIK